MRLVLDHFGSHVLERAAECVSLLVCIGLNAPSKITEFDDVTIFDQNVLGLDVPVD